MQSHFFDFVLHPELRQALLFDSHSFGCLPAIEYLLFLARCEDIPLPSSTPPPLKLSHPLLLLLLLLLAMDDPGQRCQWADCQVVAPDAELLYLHLCNDHIGRKSTNNLCLTCKWKDCGTTCAKRDHITSHLRGTPPFFFFFLS